MSKDIISVIANITLIATSDGGRQTPIKSGYRPNHVFEYDENNFVRTFIGEVQFDVEEIKPGETSMATVFFLKVPAIMPLLHKGRVWWIHEGGKLVGRAEIVSEVVFQDR